MGDKHRVFGVSTEPGESVIDKQQRAFQEAAQKETDVTEHETIQVNHEAVNEEPDELDQEPKEAEEVLLEYVPMKDFEARVNKIEFTFRKGVRTLVTRDVANMLLEDESRGYVRE